MYITNDPQIATIAEKFGVDRIFVDFEYIRKDLRQGGMNTVQNHHTTDDIKLIKNVVNSAEILVRVNPIHDASAEYTSSETEIQEAIAAGAQIIMLPYFKTPLEVKRFLSAVNGRAKTMLLFETREAVENIHEILRLEGIDEVFIGLNDLSISYDYEFMFKPLATNLVEDIINQFKEYNIPYGFGGIAALGKGLLPSEKIIAEHYRMGSSSVILSRSFCNTENAPIKDVENIFAKGIKQIRDYEAFCCDQQMEFFNENQSAVKAAVSEICKQLQAKHQK